MHVKVYVSLLCAFMSFASFSQQISLPLELLSADTAMEQVTIPSRLDSDGFLFLQIHGLKYEGQASVRLNDGSWYTLLDSDIIFPDNQYGGQGGGYHTLRFRIPLDVLGGFEAAKEQQSLRFRYNGTDGNTIGYRVLKINFTNALGENLLSRNRFVFEDPTQWMPPIAGQQAINRGKELWETAAILDRPGGSAIKAKCASCHTTGGEDLEYFSYSNKSIIERSKFHSLSEEEGEMIASYIRSLGTNGKIERLGRPYNPPYQPGKSLEAQPVKYWAAGAGIDAVEDDEKETLRGIFPNGTSSQEIQKVVDHTKKLDITKIPLAIQFPDWNEWLPKVHPIDVWQGNYFESSEAFAYYENLVSEIDSDPDNYIFDRNFDKKIRDLQGNVRLFIERGRTDGAGSAWRAQGSEAINNIKNRYRYNDSPEFAKEQLAKWLALRYWELIKLNNWEDRAVEIRPGSEAWQWPMSSQSVHQVAPHIVADDQNSFEGQEALIGDYMSTVWYQLQLTLNSGEGLNQDKKFIVHPVDWPYQMRHLWEAAERTPDKRWEGVRTFMSLIKMYQAQSNTEGTSIKGWIMRFVHPKFLMAHPKGDTFTHESVNQYESGLSGKLQNALLLEWLDVVAQFEEEDWTRQTIADQSEVAKWAKIDSVDAVPTEEIPDFSNNLLYSVARMEHMNTLYRLIPLMENTEGIKCSTVLRLAQWAEERWPEGDWLGRLQTVECSDVPTDFYTLLVIDGMGSGAYDAGTEVTIRAPEREGYSFERWQVEGNTVIDDIYEATTTIYIADKDVTVRALYISNGSYSLSVIDGIGSGDYVAGTKITITAEEREGFVFYEWTVEGNAIVSDAFAATTTVVLVDSDAVITAKYRPLNDLGTAVYPNPAVEQVTVQTTSSVLFPHFIDLYDLNGKRVYSVVTNPDTGFRETVIPVNELASGVYILRITSSEGSSLQKLVIQ